MVSLNILKDFRSHPSKSSVPHSEIRGNPNSFRKFIKWVFFNFLKFLSFKTSSSSFTLLFKCKHRIRYNPHPQVSMSVSPENNKSKTVFQIQHLNPISPFSSSITLPPTSWAIYNCTLFQSWCYFLFPRWLQLTLLGKSLSLLSVF